MKQGFLLFCVCAFFVSMNMTWANDGEWLKEWKAAKKEFESKVKVKRPGDQQKIFGITFSKGSGIEEKLTSLDRTYALLQRNKTADNFALYEKALDAAKKTIVDYVTKNLKSIIENTEQQFEKANPVDLTPEEYRTYQRAILELGEVLGHIIQRAERIQRTTSEQLKPLRSLPARLKTIQKSMEKMNHAIKATNPANVRTYKQHITKACPDFIKSVSEFVAIMKKSGLAVEIGKGEAIVNDLKPYESTRKEPTNNPDSATFKEDLQDIIKKLEEWLKLCDTKIVEAVL